MMIRYIAIKDENNREGHGYNICACDTEGDVMEVLAETRDVIPDRTRAQELTRLLNSGDVDPWHMEDIIEDALWEMAQG